MRILYIVKNKITLFAIMMVCTIPLIGQEAGIIINEVSNGSGGSEDWVELLVIGDPLNPTNPVDLTGWIYDDNNGEFAGSSSGVGISPGYIVFGPTFNSVPPGSLIVIYNQSDKDPNIAADDPDDMSTPDGVYILPGNHPFLSGCSGLPSTSDPSYLPCTPATSTWTRTALSNTGDVAQTRKPDGSFFHGFSYGSLGAPFPTFPIGGGASFNAGSGGVGSTFAFQSGNWESSANILRSDATGRTPGAPNATVNQNFIDNISGGTLDYTNLDNPLNSIAFIDTDNDMVVDSVDADNDNDGIPDAVECAAEYIDLSAVVISGISGPIETMTGIDFTSLNTTADLTVTENGGDLSDLTTAGPAGIFNTVEHTPMAGSAVRYVSVRADTGNTLGNNVDFELSFDRPVFEIIMHFRSTERSNIQFTGAQHTEELVSSNAVITYIPGTRTLDNTSINPPEIGGNGSVRITTTNPAGMTQIAWSLIDNPSNSNAADVISIFTFSSDCDFDGDGILNRFDLDSDNDGIYDVVEAGGDDADNDGRHDDDDNNADNTLTGGIPFDANFGTGINVPTDTGADGSDDYLNLDSDGDGCSDANEAYDNANADGGDTGVFGIDPVDATTIVNTNGVVTAALPYAIPANTDGNAFDDYQEIGPDDDGDGISNTCDPFFNDVDRDGVGDGLDVDDDNDGILDITENSLAVNPSADADDDKIPNYQDATNNGSIIAPVCADVDLNGICDTLDPAFDTDGDGVANHFDLDSDNDGIPDNIEAQTTGGYIAPAATTPAEYIANNGLNNAYIAGPGLTLANTDNPLDTTPDYLDNDSDNDTILDIAENGDADNAIVVFVDDDGDGIDNLFDTIDNTVTWDVNDAVTTGVVTNLQSVYGDFDNDAAPIPVPLVSDLSFRDNCQIIAGIIATDQTICNGANPVAFTETTAASIDAGLITHQWQISTTSATAGFTNIIGEVGTVYDSGSITQDTWFKRIDTNTLNGNSCSVETNVIAVTVNDITAGIIEADQTICEGDDPIVFTEDTSTTADGTITYQWQSSTTAATGPFTDITGATTASYDSPALTQDTWFQRIDTSTLNSIACTATTNVVAVTINNITAGVIAADQTVCEGADPTAFTETTATVTNGTITYQWQSSTIAATGPFTDITGATNAIYDSSTLTQDTWFQRIDISTLNGVICNATTNVIAITVNNLTAGVIAAEQTVCEGADPDAFTETTATVAGGTVTYQWQSSVTAATGPFTNIIGATSAIYDSPALTQDTWFQRIDTSTLNSEICTAITNVIAITVNNLTAGEIAGDETICEGDDPITFTEITGTIADGVITYQWQSSISGPTGPFTDISGAMSSVYDSPALTQDTWFQRIDRSILNGETCNETTNVIAVTVNNVIAGVIAADQIIVNAQDPVAFTETTATMADGTITYQWQSSTSGPVGPFTDIPGATNATYDSPPLTQDTWFQRVDTSTLNGVMCSAITNVLSVVLDSDNDGINDAVDIDDDNDGITDEEEQNGDPNLDTDQDGVIDRLDLDADADGVNDVFEAGHGQLDMDGDGRLEGPFGTDGIPDVVQDDPDSGIVNYAVQETDGDGIDDFQDIDDDGDNVLTADENPNPDADGDPDTGDTQDSDGDGLYDYLDIDDDNDGVYTVYEDYDGDDNPLNQDSDGDTIPDYLDIDDDGDGVETQFEGVNPDNDGNPNTGNTQDTDCAIDNNCDNVPDYLDNDDDGDSFLTEDESPDPNGDGDPEDALDSDLNGIPDYLQPNDNTIPEEEDGVTVFTAMSPNGDGINDMFTITGIQGLENTVEIFNRWGGKVFESRNYGQNDNFFRGASTEGVTVQENDQLPVGTYYYVLEYVLDTGERKSRAGYLYINR